MFLKASAMTAQFVFWNEGGLQSVLCKTNCVVDSCPGV